MTSPVRNPLLANAALSILSGALIALAPSMVGDWLGVEIDGWLRLFGIALLGHAVLLVWASGRTDPVPLAQLNLLAIAPYPIAMIVLVATGLVDRPLGQALVLIDGLAVAAIAAWHGKGLRSPIAIGHAQHA